MRGWPIILHIPFLSSSLWYTLVSPTCLKLTQVSQLLLGFTENWTVFWDFYINSLQIIEDSDNGDSDNQGSTLLSLIQN